MTETERQFRAAGWSMSSFDLRKWEHPIHQAMFIVPGGGSEIMDAWLMGYAAAKCDAAMLDTQEQDR